MDFKENIIIVLTTLLIGAAIVYSLALNNDKNLNRSISEPKRDTSNESKALAVLHKVCPILFDEYRNDFDIVSVEHKRQCVTWDCQQYGWPSSYMITIKISDNPSKIPTKLRLFNHTIKFEIGNGMRPGIAMSKGARLCGHQNKQKESGSNIIVDESLAKTLEYSKKLK